MSSPATSTASVLKAMRRFRRSRRGTAAIEFAMVAPVFFALLFAILETGIMFLADQVLETIAQESARTVLTGQAQAANYPNNYTATVNFKTGVVCPLIPALFTCANIYVDVESYPTPATFASVNLPTEIDGSGNFQSGNMQYNPGNKGDIVVLRIFYQWQLFVTGFGLNLSNLSGSKRLLVATAAFRNEP